MLPRRLERLPARPLDSGGIVHEAATPAARLLGLAFLDDLPYDHALLIPHCRSVHTFGMRFPLDVVFVDERGGVLRASFGVPRRRVLFCRGAFAVLEANPGEAVLFTPLSPPAARGAGSAP